MLHKKKKRQKKDLNWIIFKLTQQKEVTNTDCRIDLLHFARLPIF